MMPVVMPPIGAEECWWQAAGERLRHLKTMAAERDVRADDGLDLAFAPDPTVAGPSGVTGYSWITARGD